MFNQERPVAAGRHGLARQQVQQRQPLVVSKRKASPPSGQQHPALQQAQRLVQAPFVGSSGATRQLGVQLRHATRVQDAEAWVRELLHLADASSAPLVVGFDSETSVVWRRRPDGSSYTLDCPVSLMQLLYHPVGQPQAICLLLQLSNFGVSKQTVEVLTHPNIIKAGIGITDDMVELQRWYEHAAAQQPQALLDLDWLANACGLARPLPDKERAAQASRQAAGLRTFYRPQSWGLSGLLQAATQHRLDKKKKVQASNWARMPLSEEQLSYACADALAGLLCFQALRLRWLQQQPDAHEGQQQRQQQRRQQRVDLPELTQECGPSSPAREQAWQALLVRGVRATDVALQRSLENAVWRAAEGDCSGSGWAVTAEVDVSGGRSGYMDNPW